jgi:response regulator RpfG family c-di-GMP phosphodiesterase
VADTNSSNHHHINKKNRKSILVLDVHVIVTIIEQSLQGLGFSVSAFTDPQEALEYFHSNFKDCCSIVISDIRMPSMNGYEFIKKVKRIKPECRTILMSAFDTNNVEFSNVLPDITIDTFLQKPFSIKKLKNLITEKYSN